MYAYFKGQTNEILREDLELKEILKKRNGISRKSNAIMINYVKLNVDKA